jgi:hypothetical protein
VERTLERTWWRLSPKRTWWYTRGMDAVVGVVAFVVYSDARVLQSAHECRGEPGLGRIRSLVREMGIRRVVACQ